MKKLLPIATIVIFVGTILLYFLLFRKNEDSADAKKEVGRLHYKISDLSEEILAQSGPHQVLKSEIDNSAAMKAFRNKERDILFVLVYKQFVAYSEKPPTQLDFSFSKLSLSTRSLLEQYAIPLRSETKISFGVFDPSDGVAKVDGQLVQMEDVDFNNFIWAGFESEIFRYKLRDIDKKLKDQVIQAESKKLNMSKKQYKEKYIFEKLPMEISEKDTQSYLQKYKMDDTPRNRNNAQTRLQDMRKRRAIDYILEKYIMDLPILVNLESLPYDLEVKDNLTPSFGDGELKVTFFGDTQTETMSALLQELMEAFRKYPSVIFYFRPIFQRRDESRYTMNKGQLCVWKNSKTKFWNFFKKTMGSFSGDSLKKLTAEASGLGISESDLKKCLNDPEMDKVVKYHLDYARYLGIEVGPVLYIGGEVFNGHINRDEVEKALKRHLNIPSAGIWSIEKK